MESEVRDQLIAAFVLQKMIVMVDVCGALFLDEL